MMGIILILASMMFYGFSIVTTNHVLSDPSFDDVAMYDRYFYLFLFQIPVYLASIGLDSAFGKTVVFT